VRGFPSLGGVKGRVGHLEGGCYHAAISAITLHLVSETDAAEVLRFELENCAFFERTVAGFGDDYYTLETVRRTLAARVLEREEGASYFYLTPRANWWGASASSACSAAPCRGGYLSQKHRVAARPP
jgi:hypothetical protein